MDLEAEKNRFCNSGDIKLMKAAQPVVTPDYAPANPRSQKLRTNLVISRRVNRAKQISGLKCKFESVRIELFSCCGRARLFNATETLRAGHKNRTSKADAESFHSARLS